MSDEITCVCCKSYPKACDSCGIEPATVVGPDATHSALHRIGVLGLGTQHLCDSCYFATLEG